VFVEKVAGALAERLAPLKSVAEVAGEVNDRSRSFGIALTACTTPAAGKAGFDLPDDEVEVGVGIHGEPGRRREALVPARELVEIAVGAVDDDLPVSGQDLLVMVNGLGGTPLVELYVAFNDVAEQIAARDGDVVVHDHGRHLDPLVLRELGGHLEVEDVARVVLDDVQHAGTAAHELRREDHLVRDGAREDLAGACRITRSLVGNYITSLDMSGFTVTVCRLTEDLTSLWAAPVSTPALRWGHLRRSSEFGGRRHRMGSETLQLTNADGLHARPAGRFATEASRYGCDMQVGKGDRFVNGKSIMRLLTLDCRAGDEIVITTDGTDADEALERLVRLVRSGLGEDRDGAGGAGEPARSVSVPRSV
jgi:phosphotransferase system HPr (HPr) family protein